MAKRFIFILCFSFSLLSIAQITIKDSQTKSPVSYATVSFGNGNGIFADDAGVFIFNKKLYPDIDSLFISALGYKNIDIATKDLPQQLFLEPYANELDAVIIGIKRKFKTEKAKPYLDDDYYKCWLPTIESEIAVFFPNNDDRLKRIASVKFPIALESRDWKKRKKSNSDKKSFSTLFKVNFYENENGKPGQALTFETIVFRATEKDGDFHELNVSKHDIFIPKAGVFVSLQVLGYTDKFGKLLPNKKYKEVKGKSGIVKIPTNFRPLLPFTNEISENRTYIKRVFINENNWIQFKKGNDFSSSLLKNGLNNYGIGMNINIFKDE